MMTADHDDLLSFVEEDHFTIGEPPTPSKQPWVVLIVDDDRDVHEATIFALSGITIQRRPLKFLHAYAGSAALEILRRETDIAVILLDVVMESNDAGLRIIPIIREQLGLLNTRIILRTGQPGYAPEIETISHYDINDYKTKSELVRNKLYTTLTTAIRNYDQLCQLDASRRGLAQIIAATNQCVLEQGPRSFAEGLIAQVAAFIGVEPDGLVCTASNAAASDALISAATGRYRPLLHQSLQQLQDEPALEYLTRCLQERRNVVNAHSMALFLPTRDDQALAVLVTSPTPLREMDTYLLNVFCVNIALCADNVALVARLRNYAFVDGLVNLPNRAAFIQSINQALQQQQFSNPILALIDIDQFAEINDLFGHRYGDQLLCNIARRLEQEPLHDCLIARISGDQFAVFGEERQIRPETLQAIFAAPFAIAAAEHRLSVSMGMARVDAQSRRGDELLKDAAITLKHAKAGGLGQYAYYSERVRIETRERTKLLHDLRRAFDHQFLFLVYQPQVNLQTQQVVEVEALLRWRNEQGQFIPPDQFIPIAEQSGLIVSIGHWLLRVALYDLLRLQAAGYSDISMAVNVSAVQFRQPSFVEMVDAALRDTGANPQSLELEITESVAVLGADHVSNILSQIRQRGIRVAIDDFGTGFSSLSYLDRFPANRLKIDRSFVWALDAEKSEKSEARIAELVVTLGRKLGMNVLAEGVETVEQAQLLRNLECDDAQGYLFAKPMPIDDLLGWLGTRSGEIAP